MKHLHATAAKTPASSLPPQAWRPALQRKAHSAHDPVEVPAAVSEVLRSPGQPLQDDLRGVMQARFGADFSRVRVHADAHAGTSARAVDAAAYTVGHHVVFGAQQFAPSTERGRRLLAHELAHVLQQGAQPAVTNGLAIGAVGDAHEAQADRAADAVMRGGHAPAIGSAPRATLQRQPLPDGAPLVGSASNLPSAGVDIEGDEAISAASPKLVDLAARYKTDAGASGRIEISASLSEAAQLSSVGEQAERSRLLGRMDQIRNALVSIGVPRDRIDVTRPTAYATSAHGQVSVDLRRSASGLSGLPLGLPGSQGGPSPRFAPQSIPPAPTRTLPSLADLLTLKVGPLTIELPKSISARLPIALSAAKSLVIELKAEAPAKFSFKLTLDGTPYLRVSAVAGAQYDTDKKAATGAAGLEIESVKTTCHASNPDETRSKIAAAGDKLTKASQAYASTKDAGKLIEIAGALGEMYDAIDKAKAACKQVPRFKVEFGVKGPLGPADEGDPSKRPPSVLGGTLTIPF